MILPISYPDYTTDIRLKQDTLTLHNEYKYIRVKGSVCRQKDLFSNRRINIHLKPSGEQSKPLDSLGKTNISFIHVGPLKEGLEDIYEAESDSIFIQVNDVFIEFDAIEDFADPGHNNDFAIAINADQNVPEYFLDSIFNKLDKVLHLRGVYITTFNDQLKEIEFEKKTKK